MCQGVRPVITMLLLSLEVPREAPATWGENSPRNSASVEAGIFWPFGDWTGHRFAQGVNQFQRGLALGIELEHRFSELVGMAVMGGYGSLDVSDWENYARSKGDFVEGSAYVFYGGARLKFYLFDQGSHSIKVGFGGLYFSSHGQEQFRSFVYNYDFFANSSAAFLAGMEYDVSIGTAIAGMLKIDLVVLPSGVEYVDGRTFSVYAVPTTLGFRFFF